MKTLQTGVLGAGRFGRNLIRNVQRAPGFRLTGVCDVRPDRWPDSRAVPCTTDPGEMLESATVDAVVIATPPETHVALVEAALHAGKHVLCEKPLAFDPDDCWRLHRLASANRRCLMVDCTPVYLEEIRAARERIPWDKVAGLSCRRWSARRPEHAVDAIWDLGPHDLAVLDLWLGGLPEEWTFASISGGVRLTAFAAGGIRLEVEMGYAAEPVREITVASLDWVRSFRQSQTAPEPLQSVLAEFAAAIREGREPLTSAPQAACIAEILQGVSHAVAH